MKLKEYTWKPADGAADKSTIDEEFWTESGWVYEIEGSYSAAELAMIGRTLANIEAKDQERDLSVMDWATMQLHAGTLKPTTEEDKDNG